MINQKTQSYKGTNQIAVKICSKRAIAKDQDETSVRFELISARFEHRSLLVTNHPFDQWNQVFQNTAMTLAAVDRLVHHSAILEMNVESYRLRAAKSKRPCIKATVQPRKARYTGGQTQHQEG